jgi:hypothetical protein
VLIAQAHLLLDRLFHHAAIDANTPAVHGAFTDLHLFFDHWQGSFLPLGRREVAAVLVWSRPRAGCGSPDRGSAGRGVPLALAGDFIGSIGLGRRAVARPAALLPSSSALINIDCMMALENVDHLIYLLVFGAHRHERAATADAFCVITSLFLGYAYIRERTNQTARRRTDASAR